MIPTPSLAFVRDELRRERKARLAVGVTLVAIGVVIDLPDLEAAREAIDMADPGGAIWVMRVLALLFIVPGAAILLKALFRPANAETSWLALALQNRVRTLRQENRPRIADPQWTSFGGHNLAAWADRGYAEALGVLGRNPPSAAESAAGYAARLRQRLEERRAASRDDPADQDGGATGALGDAIEALDDLAKGS